MKTRIKTIVALSFQFGKRSPIIVTIKVANRLQLKKPLKYKMNNDG